MRVLILDEHDSMQDWLGARLSNPDDEVQAVRQPDGQMLLKLLFNA